MSFLRLNNIVKKYDVEAVLNDVSFSLEKGGTLAVLGASGSGKSTLFKIIAGLISSDGGEIILDDKILLSASKFVKPQNRGIGLVFQEDALFPHLNVIDNITLGLKKDDNIEESLDYYLSIFGIKGFEKRYPHELSGGEKQRVSIIRSLIRKPKILLMDEPFSNLDIDLRNNLRNDLKRILLKEKITTIIITHDKEDVFSLADSLILIHAGIIVAEGDPALLYSNPQNEISAKYYSSCSLLIKNELSSEFFDYFKLESNSIAIPKEAVKLNGTEEAVVSGSLFNGKNYDIIINFKGVNLKAESSNKVEIGESLHFSIDKEKLIFF